MKKHGLFCSDNTNQQVEEIFQKAEVEGMRLRFNSIKEKLFNKIEEVIKEGCNYVEVHYTGEYSNENNFILTAENSDDIEKYIQELDGSEGEDYEVCVDFDHIILRVLDGEKLKRDIFEKLNVKIDIGYRGSRW